MIGVTKNDFKNNPQVDWEKGHFYEGGWLSLVPYMASILFDPIKYAFGLKEMTKIIQSNGITTIAEPGFPSASFDLEYNGIKKEMSKSPYYETYLIPNITQKMLTQQLRDLEADGLINRTAYSEIPPRVEYSLTDYAKELGPILCELGKWGERLK